MSALKIIGLLFMFHASLALAAPCPKSSAEWLKFRDTSAGAIAARNLVLGDAGEGSLDKLIRGVAGVFTSCAPAADDLPALAPLQSFALSRKNSGIEGFALGFNVPDATYFRDTESLTAVPEPLRAPELLALLSEPAHVNEGIAMIEKLNEALPLEQKMIVFKYRSQHLTTPDESRVFGRVLVVVPGNPERWVQYGVPEAGKPKTRNLSVVAVRKNPEGTTDIYFKDHYRMYDRDKIYLKARFDVTGSSDNCVNCHKSGVLPVFPEPGSYKIEDEWKLAAINKRFRTYGAPGFGGYVDPISQGPGLGANDGAAASGRSDSFLQACTSEVSFPDRALAFSHIKDAMNCAKCHDGLQLGSLNYPLNRVLLHSFVEGGKMPPQNSLTTDERRGLVHCLEAEYFGSGPASFTGWLRGLF
jgi:hypothetical protein